MSASPSTRRRSPTLGCSSTASARPSPTTARQQATAPRPARCDVPRRPRGRRRRAGIVDSLVGGAMDVVQSVANEVAPGIVESIDIDEVARQVDVQAIVDKIDVESVVERVDVERVIEKVDVQALVDKVDVQSVVDK